MVTPAAILPLFVSSSNMPLVSTVSYPASALIAIVTCRMVLNMRTYAHGTSDTGQPTMAMQVTNERMRALSRIAMSGDEEMGEEMTATSS